MFYLSLLLLLVPQEPPPAGPPAEPNAPVVRLDVGPLRGEIVAMREMRFFLKEPEANTRMQSELGFQIRIVGERITEIVRTSSILLLTEVVDDTGKSLVDNSNISEAEKKGTRAVRQSADQVRSAGLAFLARCKPAERSAKQLKIVRGTVRLILAKDTERVTVDNPLQWVGKKIENPRLKELGVEVEIVPYDQLENAPPAERSIAFRYTAKGENVQAITFYDGSLRSVPARDTTVQTKSGEAVSLYYFDAAGLNSEIQAIFDIHPTVEDIPLEIKLENVPLP
jgi:hypothetical protein